MLPVALAVMAGIVLGRYLPLPMGVFVLVTAAAILLAVATVRRQHLHLLTAGAVLLAVLGLSSVYSQATYYTVSGGDIVTYSSSSPVLATVRGLIVTSPLLVEDEPGSTIPYRRPARTCFIVECRQIKKGNASPQPAPAGERPERSADDWLPCTGQSRVTVREEARHLSAGQEVELIGVLGRSTPANNPGEIDWVEQGRLEGLMTNISVPAADGAIVRSAPDNWLKRAYWHVRSAARQHLAGCGEVGEGRLLNALLTGERHPALKTLNQAMVRSGTAHFLSISGQHLAVFLLFIYGIARLTRLGPRHAAMLVLGLLAAYLLLAEPNAPLLRSAVMAGCICLGTIFTRQYSALNSVSVATVIVLAIDPMDLFSAGFQLSFGIVGGMILLHEPIRDVLFGRFLRRRGLMVFRDDQALARFVRYTVANWAIVLVTAAVSASLVSMPLVAYHFGLFSPYAPVMSVLLSPLVMLVLVPGYLSMALAWPMPHLSAAMGSLSADFADWLSRAVMWADRLPGLCMSLRPVGLVWTILFFVIVVVWLLLRNVPFRRPALAVLATGWVGLTVWTQLPASPPMWAELNILAVGDGQCAVLRTPAGRTYLFDVGTRTPIDLPRQVLMPFVYRQRLPLPREAWISHADSDHYNALPAIMRSCPLRVCRLSEYFESSPPGPDDGEWSGDTPPAGAKGLLAGMVGGNVQIMHVRQGQVVELDSRTTVQVLWPPVLGASSGPAAGAISSNNSSLVLKITCDDKSVLLAGDLEAQAQAALSADPSARADVLILPHHGSFRPTLPELVDKVGASMVLASNSRALRAPPGRPDAAEFLSHMEHGRMFLSTSRNGFIKLTFGRGRLTAESTR